jgi:hypothetical protein
MYQSEARPVVTSRQYYLEKVRAVGSALEQVGMILVLHFKVRYFTLQTLN